jgi:hypothetical protein
MRSVAGRMRIPLDPAVVAIQLSAISRTFESRMVPKLVYTQFYRCRRGSEGQPQGMPKHKRKRIPRVDARTIQLGRLHME